VSGKPVEITVLQAKAYPYGSGTVTGSGPYIVGSTVQVQAIPAKGLQFAGWIGDAPGIDAKTGIKILQFSLIERMEITAVFGDTSEDSDHDGLADIYEKLLGTNPYVKDTDNDKIPDGNEIAETGTDPLLPDTDGDGHQDRTELLNGTSPTDPDDFPFFPLDALARHFEFKIKPYDISGNGGHGKALEVEMVDDRNFVPKRAFGFNGASSYVEASGYAGVKGSGARAISGWLRSETGTPGPILACGAGNSSFTLRIGTGGTLEVVAGRATLSGQTPIADGTWHQFLVTLPEGGTPSDIASYIDGQPDATTLSGDNGNPRATTPKGSILIGKDQAKNFFTGELDEIRLWERDLHPSEAAKLYDLEKYVEPDEIRPAITEHPSQQTIAVGGTAVLTATVTGKPAPTYKWESIVDRKWTAVKGATSATLLITNVKPSDATNYRVIATNASGSATSRTVKVNVLDIPVITEQPSDTSLQLGKGGKLYAVVEGSPKIEYEWFKDGQSLGLSKGNIWDIPSDATQQSHGGTYSFVATNSVGQAASATFTLSIIEVAAITAHPVSAGVTQGQPASLSLTTTGGGDIAYQWYKYDPDSRQYFPVNGATSATLAIQAMSQADAGTYKAMATNGASTLFSKPAILDLQTLPAFSTHPASLAQDEGTNATFEALATGQPQPKYQWQKYDPGSAQWLDLPRMDKPTLAIGRSDRAHSGKYRAIATNPAGSATSKDATLTVYYKPVVTQDPQATTANEGTSTTLSVLAQALDNKGTKANYQWFYGRTQLEDGNGISGSLTAALSLTDVDRADAGSYYCVLSNSVGETKSRTAKLTITEKPYTSKPLADTTRPEGKNLSLGVAVYGTKPMDYQWYKDGQPIQGANLTKLYFSALTPSDAGQYTFEATNPAGTLTTSMALTVEAAQDTGLRTIAGADTETPEADPDGDGLANLLEQALGSDPANPESTYSPTLEIVEDGNGETFVSFHYTLDKSATGITTLVEQSFDLQTWEPVDPNEATVQTIDHGDLTETTVFLPTSSGARFLRIRVEK
jgi:hypothetical protein